MVIELIEVYDERMGTIHGHHKLRSIYLNPEHVVSIHDSPETKQLMVEGNLPQGLNSQVSFSTVTINKGTYGQEVIVVGNPNEVRDKLFSKQLLRG